MAGRDNAFDMQIKLLMIGDSGVGKTCLLLRYANDSFSPAFTATEGVSFDMRIIPLGGTRIKLQIWDTAGQERFRTITTSYFRGAQGILLVYDVTDRNSFISIRNWVAQIQMHADVNVNKILIGNKCDCQDQRAISYEEGEALAKEYNIHFYETSAKQDLNVEKSFITIATDVKNRLIADGGAGAVPGVGAHTEQKEEGVTQVPSKHQFLKGWCTRCAVESKYLPRDGRGKLLPCPEPANNASHHFTLGWCDHCGEEAQRLVKDKNGRFLPCPDAPELPEEGVQKAPRKQLDSTQATVRTLCPTFDPSVVSDIALALNALESPNIATIPFERIINTDSSLNDMRLFKKTDGEEACDLVNAFVAFESRCKELRSGMSEELVLCAITSITALMWKTLASNVEKFGALLSYNYNAKDLTGATQNDARPDETVFIDDFLASKGEHKRTNTEIKKAILEQHEKLAGYNHVEYGPHIVCLPVYSAAGSIVVFGVIDVRTKEHFEVSRHDLDVPAQRVNCFISSINCFRFLRTMVPYIPSNPSPMFKVQQGLTFFDKYVLKKIPETCSCPPALYDILGTGSVPFAATVVRRGKDVKVSPVGVRTPDKGEGLTLDEVRAAVRACLTCLSYIHSRNYVHRDIRWANLIRIYDSRQDGSVESVRFLVIDFEFAGVHGEPMLIHGYIFREVVAYGEIYLSKHDIFCVGKLIRTWADSNDEILDEAALRFIDMLQSGEFDAQAALEDDWLM